MPNPDLNSEWFEIPAGLLDGDPETRPDKHIFIEDKASWFTITDNLLQLTKEALIKLRSRPDSTS